MVKRADRNVLSAPAGQQEGTGHLHLFQLHEYPFAVQNSLLPTAVLTAPHAKELQKRKMCKKPQCWACHHCWNSCCMPEPGLFSPAEPGGCQLSKGKSRIQEKPWLMADGGMARAPGNEARVGKCFLLS